MNSGASKLPVLALATLASALLLSSAPRVSCSLSAYSETRSFRDALDGRSMKEALSGPVDMDTSSYGERAAGSGAPTNGQTSSTMMPLSVPANGNLNGNQAQEQQKSANGSPMDDGELEREAVPASDAADQQQQSKSARLVGGAWAARSRSTQANGASQRARSGRLMQAEQQPGYGGRQSAPGSNGYADSGASAEMGATRGQQAPSYGGRDGAQAAYGAQPTSAPVNEQQKSGEPMTQNGNDEQQQDEASYAGPETELQAEKLLAAMMASNRKTDASQQRAAYGVSENGSAGQAQKQLMAMRALQMAMAMNNNAKQQPSAMAQSMMMSLANKAAYANGQQARSMTSQRQMAPPMFAAANGQQQSAAYNSVRQVANERGGLRRANQRRREKKMSPAMMNAMLNQLLGRQADAYAQDTSNGSADQSSAGNAAAAGYSGGSSDAQPAKPQNAAYGLMAQMMRSPVGQEMLADMMLANGGQQQYTNGEQPMVGGQRQGTYRRTLMSAMKQRQQQQTDEQESEQQQQQQVSSNYGERQSPLAMSKMMMLMMRARQQAYGPGMPTSGASTAGYEAGAQRQMPAEQQSAYGQQATSSKIANGMQQEQGYENNRQQQPVGDEATKTNGVEAPRGGYGRVQSSMMRPAMSYGNRAAQQASVSPLSRAAMGAMMSSMMAGNGYGAAGSMEQRRQTRMMAQNGKSGVADEQAGAREQMSGQGYGEQQQQQGGASGAKGHAAADSDNEQPLTEGTKSAEANSVNGAAPAGQHGAEQLQQRSNGAGEPSGQTKGDHGNGQQDEQQQQRRTDEYGAAPMGQAEPFAFNYNIDDNYGNQQYRKEESDKNGVVRGSYGYMDMSGIYRHVEYVADENGFRANIKSNEPGLNGAQSTSMSADSGARATGSNGAPTQQQQQQLPAEPIGAAAVAPPSTSSSLGGSGSMAPLMALIAQQQQDTQLPMTPLMDMQRQLQTAGGNQEEQKGQYSPGSGVQQQQQTSNDNGKK